jgi:uncharacterized protein YifN (PemK superfamily)
MNTDTPETDAMVSADQHHLEDDNFFPASIYWRMCDLARTLERERDEAREELATVTAQRDSLAEALRFATAYPLSESWYNQAIQALATLKP